MSVNNVGSHCTNVQGKESIEKGLTISRDQSMDEYCEGKKSIEKCLTISRDKSMDEFTRRGLSTIREQNVDNHLAEQASHLPLHLSSTEKRKPV